MSKKKPSLIINKKERLADAKRELSAEKMEIPLTPSKKNSPKSVIRTSLSLEPDLLHAVQEIALIRKKSGENPCTVTGIMREALIDLVIKSKLDSCET